MKQIRKRLTYANVMSTIAVFLVVGGASAFAASQLGKNTVGSKQIKKNAVTSAKIKNGAVTQAKIATAAQNALKGAVGPQGPQGPQGQQGGRGPSNARTASVLGNEQLGNGEGSALVVTSLTLPAGKWVLVGETALTNVSGASRSAWCSLNSGATQLGVTRGFDEAAGTQRSTDATVLGSVDLPSGGVVQFKCWATGTGVFTPSGSKPAILAIQVETLN